MQKEAHFNFTNNVLSARNITIGTFLHMISLALWLGITEPAVLNIFSATSQWFQMALYTFPLSIEVIRWTAVVNETSSAHKPPQPIIGPISTSYWVIVQASTIAWRPLQVDRQRRDFEMNCDSGSFLEYLGNIRLREDMIATTFSC
jgi:hypothetical protein